MTDGPEVPRDATVSDTVERIRAAHFPDIPRDLVLLIMSLHASDGPENLNRQMDEAIAARARETV